MSKPVKLALISYARAVLLDRRVHFFNRYCVGENPKHTFEFSDGSTDGYDFVSPWGDLDKIHGAARTNSQRLLHLVGKCDGSFAVNFCLEAGHFRVLHL